MKCYKHYKNKTNKVKNFSFTQLLLMLAMVFSSLLHAQQISNVRAEQDEYMTKLSYEISGFSRQSVQLFVSIDNQSFLGPLKAISGDVQDVLPGERSMVWDVLKEPGFESFESNNMNFKVELVNEPIPNAEKPIESSTSTSIVSNPTSANHLIIDPNWEPEVQKLVNDLVKVEGGTFKMGCTAEQNNCESDERPVRDVTLSTFYMGKYEVTQAQWQAVMGSNPSRFYKCDQCPVESISWIDVQQFLTKLNQITSLEFRLPSEAEWEYAVRGGNKSKGYQYAGSDNLETVAWYEDNSSSKTHPIGELKPNELGLYDMSGNVLEWCSDWYEKNYYRNSPSNNPSGPLSGSRRVLRGGSWRRDAQNCRSAYREIGTPDYSIYFIGFRLSINYP